MPGRPNAEKTNQSYQYALCNTWIGENEGEYRTGYTDIGINQADGAFHKYRFDWHTGDENEEARVEFYFDDVLVYTSKEYIPTNAGRLWLGLWFPNSWAGTPDFETSDFEIDSVKITPFHEAGDTEQNETYPEDGWATSRIFLTNLPCKVMSMQMGHLIFLMLSFCKNGCLVFQMQNLQTGKQLIFVKMIH